MFRRRDERTRDVTDAEAAPATTARPTRAPTGMAGLGLRARPSGLGARLRSILGVGATRSLSAVRWGVTTRILWAWVLTIPVSALVGALCYKLTSAILGP